MMACPMCGGEFRRVREVKRANEQGVNFEYVEEYDLCTQCSEGYYTFEDYENNSARYDQALIKAQEENF